MLDNKYCGIKRYGIHDKIKLIQTNEMLYDNA